MAKRVTRNPQALLKFYEQAKNWVGSSPFVQDIRWQESVYFSHVTEQYFLREYAWVVLNSGFKEQIIRQYFDYISLCFCDWESAEAIDEISAICVESAYLVFRNRRKLEAIAGTAQLINNTGFPSIKLAIEENTISALKLLPFIGDVTAWHLAKNLGIDVAKPDRHLVRLATTFGYEDVHRMCEDIHTNVGDRISVIDIILWRFAERSNSMLVNNVV